MPHRIVGWIGYGSMGNLVQRKSFSRIADAALDHVACSYVRDFDLLVRIEASAVLNRVDQHFPKGRTHCSSFREKDLRWTRFPMRP